MKKVIIFGTSDFAEVVYYYLSNNKNYEVICFTLDKEFIKEVTFQGLPVIDFERIQETYSPNEYEMFVALGYSKVNKIRELVYTSAKKKGYKLLTYISDKVTMYDNVLIGDNCFIFEDNTLQPFSKIGNNTIMWSGNHLGHHSIIGNNCFITSHVVIAGKVQIGDNTFIGINSTIRDHILIGKENVIGAGSIILGDTTDQAVYSPNETEKSRVPSNRLRSI